MNLTQDATLSTNDARVLNALFDPESSPSSAIRIESTSKSLPHTSESDLPSLKAAEAAAIRPLNTANPSSAAIDSALSALTDLIASHPDYASAYANRAQVLRMKLGAELFAASSSLLANRLFADLSRAIALASPSAPGASLSPAQAALLATTHTHRGYLLMKAATLAGAAPQGTLEGGGGPDELRGVGQDELEELASRDFFMGGRYGDREARQLAVRTNPYAKMCGAIVKEAMRKEMEGAKGLREEILGEAR
jgi:hypothetical protein